MPDPNEPVDFKIRPYRWLRNDLKALVAQLQEERGERVTVNQWIIEVLVEKVQEWRTTGRVPNACFRKDVQHDPTLAELIPPPGTRRQQLAQDADISIERLDQIAQGELPTDSEIIELAGALGREPDELFDWVKHQHRGVNKVNGNYESHQPA